ncbi:MAG: toll/interleukin-1 receptor domain-containing protein [Rhodospirillales bacterium]|nr:MAG: toll/interleukin-1 receptor domain-containing protein [Rhodospirillales bacterium]
MSGPSTVQLEIAWSVLIESIVEGRIIPILGSEILEINDNGIQIPFYRWVALRLAEANDIRPNDLPAEPTLNDVVCRLGDDRQRVYSTIKHIVDGARLKPPAILLKLAAIIPIKLFVVLTFDPFMTAALDVVRSSTRTSDRAYPEDIPSDKINELDTPVVYHLFGKLTHNVGGYVVSDEDMLERLYEIQSGEKRPKILFDALANNNLLFIGCNFSDWLSRFLIRTAKGKRLSNKSEKEILVDTAASKDNNLIIFLKKFSPQTYVMPDKMDDFINELERRWGEHANLDRRNHKSDMPHNSIFISYCREDVDIAGRIAAILDKSGFNVWLDRREIKPGEDFTRTIQNNIEKCSCFIPVISENTSSQNEGYFYREWRWACERSESFAPGVRFILPVIIDDTEAHSPRIFREFCRLDIAKLPGGEVPDQFIELVRQTVRDNTKRRGHG